MNKWKLEELAEKSQDLLGSEGDSNRIQWKPTGRQIRYYTTLGLLDKPFGGRGKGATYGPKHLLQLLAIKRLQHQGLKLAEIQPILTGQSQQRLAELLGYSQDWLEQLETEDTKEEALPERRQANFWSSIPEVPSRRITVNQYCHFEIAPGATLVASQTTLDHLDDKQRQDMAAELLAVWQKYQQ